MGKATKDGGSSNYFKTLFGKIAKIGLSLFSCKNPFYRKRNEGLKHGSDVGVDGAFEQGKRKNKAKSGDTLDQIKKKTYGENDEAIGKKQKNTVSKQLKLIEQLMVFIVNNNSTGKKKEKFKDDENSRNSELGKVKTEIIGEKDENLDLRTVKNKSNSENGEDLDIKKARKKVFSGNELASVSFSYNITAKKKKQVKGDGNSNKLGQEKTETEIASQNYENLDLTEEKWRSTLKIQEDEVMPREKHLKRQLEQANNEPNKRIKVRYHHFEEVEGGARMGSTVVTESKEKARTGFKGKSMLQKRKWDAFEEEHVVRQGLGDGEHTSKEVVIPEKITGKRKWGEDALDMVVNKQDRDDSEKLERTVFVGNLPLWFKRKKLIREFSQFGEVESLGLRSVPIVDTKLPRKGAILKGKVNASINSVHAYIVFKDAQSVNAALSRNMTEFSGNHIRVDRAHPPRKKLKDGKHFIYDTRMTLFVGNLPLDVKEHHFSSLQCQTEKLRTDIDRMRSELRYEVDKVTAGRRLDLNLERGCIRDELANQSAETSNLTNKLDRCNVRPQTETNFFKDPESLLTSNMQVDLWTGTAVYSKHLIRFGELLLCYCMLFQVISMLWQAIAEKLHVIIH